MSLSRSTFLVAVLALFAGGSRAHAQPANDTPFTPVVIEGCAAVMNGTTIGSANDVDMLNCTNDSSGPGYVQPYGGDVFYRVTIPSSYSMHVLVEPVGDWDVSVYVFTSPYNPHQTCVDGKDIAGPGIAESVRIDNAHLSGQPREYMIAVDSWRADVAGDFILSITCDFAVPVGEPTFSTLKSRFHERVR